MARYASQCRNDFQIFLSIETLEERTLLSHGMSAPVSMATLPAARCVPAQEAQPSQSLESAAVGSTVLRRSEIFPPAAATIAAAMNGAQASSADGSAWILGIPDHGEVRSIGVAGQGAFATDSEAAAAQHGRYARIGPAGDFTIQQSQSTGLPNSTPFSLGQLNPVGTRR